MVKTPASGQASPDALVIFDQVHKSYDGLIKVVENLNLEIETGEFLTLLGPSGSGKTTTLMMLAGFEAPTSGDIYFAGTSITDVPTYKRNFGMVFQNYALFPHMTVEENLAFPLRMHKFAKSEIAPRVKRALDIVKLDKLADRKPQQLSGGQQQRVALARALVFEPRMVLMDEPLGALDKQLRERMQIEIKTIHDELGLTMLYVTHDQAEALTMSDRIAVFNDGQIQHVGRPTDVYNSPSNSFVASFMGENNTLTGEVLESRPDGLVLRSTAGGAEIKGRASNNLGTGDKANILIRPERIAIASEHVDNQFEARIRAIIFHGDHLRLTLDVDGIGQLVAKLPFSEGLHGFNIGDLVGIGWSAQGTLVFAVEEE